MTDTTAPTPNVPLLRQTLAYIEAHPEEWNQTTWRCGTSACFAGHAAILDGGAWADEESACVTARADDLPDDVFGAAIALRVLVEDRAQRILGLTDRQADYLFDAHNGLNDLRRQVAELTGGAS